MIIALVFLTFSITCCEAHADIYRYLNEDGVECFTDTPATKNAVKVMRERGTTRRRTPPQAHPASHPRAEHPRQTGADRSTPNQNQADAAPFLPINGRITSLVGLRHDPIDGVLRDHKGIDIATPAGAPVRPIAPGVVVFSGFRTGYGNTVIVRHNDGMTTLYAHNSTNLKSEGEPVDRDSTIAFSGSTGRTTGPHLHFEAWKDGINMTATFVTGAASPHEAGRKENDGIRMTVQADGTIRFTNLP